MTVLKSEIIIAVMQAGKQFPEPQIRKKLSEALILLSLNPNHWDVYVDAPIGKAMIHTLGTSAANRSVVHLVKEVDRILKRIT